ncbi:zinc finger, CCHC-type containing protein [Tanacetum coccineum]|uniref:Zinc finger, CCHC-type containing protein n=1 Tax=Tanacetum coccineum TaxID=301880 RepID=A0ABQ5AM11_9ASTR
MTTAHQQTRKRCKWENDDYIRRGHILNGMSDALFDVYQNMCLIKELWDQLESKYMAEDASSKKFLFTQHGLNMDESISMSSIIDKLPPSWKDFKHTLKHNKDELSLVQLRSHFHIEETLRAEEGGKGKGKEIAGSSSVNMIEDSKNKNNNKNTKGKKRNNDGNNDGSNKKSKLTCWKCGKTALQRGLSLINKATMLEKHSGSGKGSKDPNSSQGLNFNFDVIPFNYYVSHISEICYVQDDVSAWWIDSGATCHACKDRCWFDTFHPVQDGSVLHMGDESTKPILGRGNVVLEFSSGKTTTLVNVVYLTRLRKNLMSGPVLNKCGYKQVYESDKYILSRHGVFVGFSYYNNGMFMLNLNKVPNTFSSVCMISSKDVDSSMWHARLGHVHYKRMLAMSKDNLIPEFDITLEKCNTCMLTKITRQPFKDIKRDSNVLELIHSDLCDFHATPSLGNKKYVVTFIDDASRFCYVYLCHAKDEALDKFKIYKTEVELQQNDLIKTLRTDRGGEYYDHVYFQSIGIIHETTAVVRLPEPKRKNLGQKGIDCIFIRYAEHSKAYRFYVIEPNEYIPVNSVIESRDAMFDEKRFTSIPRPKSLMPSSNEDQIGETLIETPTTHRSNRARVAKSFEFDFQLYLVEGSRDEIGPQYSYCYSIEEDPRTFDEAIQSCDVAFWKEAINDEMESIMENNTWILFDLPPDYKPLARLVIQGFRQKEGIDYFDTYAPVARISTIRLLIALAATYNLVIHQMDVKTVFLNGDLKEEKILKKFKCDDYCPISTPLDPTIKLMPNTGMAVDQLEYSRVIGCLMYAMTSIRPYIAYDVGKLKDHTSTTGWVFLLCGGAISWASKKQTCITDSTMEAEFVALATTGKEAEWLRNLIYEILLWPKPISWLYNSIKGYG